MNRQSNTQFRIGNFNEGYMLMLPLHTLIQSSANTNKELSVVAAEANEIGLPQSRGWTVQFFKDSGFGPPLVGFLRPSLTFM
jgi:hypothetical protein